ncbi:zinc-binding dehydrogenase [Labrys monachus]|uniref:Threonine dehydrogenase-like Zn-dependent dehydrogenase n=1 Tax=Labrys monachus TaxID=217067 RepID=A0ABU0F8P8_9HYPH|nr:zinc-binding dehydrogenase [Labrys monachus]MDQ0390984.1 threonine dehydrogenase-like Zn-dependent dehydrogenase [Labrys monachus]
MIGREIIFPGKGVFALAASGDSGPLGRNEVRGRTLATLVSPGTELAWAMGENFPIRPGYAAVFEAEECGADVRDVAAGTRLFCMGPHRSFQQVDVRYTLPVPDGMTAQTAAIARLVGVSMTTLMTTRARPGDGVVICGAGPVGYLAAHIFGHAGYDVHVVEPDATRRRQAEASGLATHAAMPLDDPLLAGRVALVADCSGHEQAVLDGCRIVRQHGEVVMIGVPWHRRTEIHAHEILQAVFTNFVVLRSGWEWELPLLSRGFKWEELLEGYNNSAQSIFSGFRRALKWLAEGRIPLDGLVRTLSPGDPQALYGMLQARAIEEPFVVLDWREL